MVFDKKTMSKSRGVPFIGECSRSLRSRQEAIVEIREAANGWSAHSGLSKLVSSNQLDGILGVLKR